MFKSAMTLHLLLAIIILILGETIGLWYVYNKLNVEPGRFHAAMWCYQLSIISTMVGLIQLPFDSALIAHEKMGVYAYMTIFDAVFKLLAAYLIQIVNFDKVIFYSVLTFIAGLLSTFCIIGIVGNISKSVLSPLDTTRVYLRICCLFLDGTRLVV